MTEGTQYGGFWVRLVALVLDNAIVFVILLAMGTLAATMGLGGEVTEIAVSLVFILVMLLYWPAMESSRWRATVGKRVMGLEVTDLDGNRLGFLQALLRSLVKIISAIPFYIGFLMAAFTARKQALHDLIVKTLVVRTGPSQLWKVILALILGIVLMAASAAGIFYYVIVPTFMKGMDKARTEVMMGKPPAKGSSQAKTSPRAPAGKPAPLPAAAAQTAALVTTQGRPGPDPEFDAIVGAPLTGLVKPGTTRAGPAILELSTKFPTQLWVKVHLPMPALAEPELMPGPMVTVNRVLDAAGADFYDAASTFEKNDFFKQPQLSAAQKPVPHLTGTRTVNLRPGLSEEALQRVEGLVSFRVPVDPKSVAFESRETGKEISAHGSAVRLVSMSGNAVRLHFRGASEHLLLVRGLDAAGKPVQV